MSTSMSLNAILVTCTSPVPHLSPRITTHNPWSSVVFSERNATALTQDTRSLLNPENFFSGLEKFLMWVTISAVARRKCLGEGMEDLIPVISSWDRIVLIISSTFPVFVALAKSYLKSSEDLRFINKRGIIKRIKKWTFTFCDYIYRVLIYGSPFQLLPLVLGG